jgi:hypothetical protein
VGEVHANDIKTGSAELVDGLNRVGLGANGADDGRAAVVALRGVIGIEVGQPGDAAAGVEVLLCVGSHDAVGSRTKLRLGHDDERGEKREEEGGLSRDEIMGIGKKLSWAWIVAG